MGYVKLEVTKGEVRRILNVFKRYSKMIKKEGKAFMDVKVYTSKGIAIISCSNRYTKDSFHK